MSGRAIKLDKSTLYELYHVRKLSQNAIAKKLHCSKDSVCKYLNVYGIPKRTYFSTKMTERITFSDNVLSVLDGALLGDGHVAKTNGNSQFVYRSSKIDHVVYVADFIKDYLTPETRDIKEKVTYDKRTDKEYTSYSIRTINNSFFTELRNRWYPHGIKIIPPDIVLNNTNLLLWYLGDGGITYTLKKGKVYSFQIKLSTHCFSENELSTILIPQLSKYNPYLYRESNKTNNEQFSIRIPRTKSYIFLKDIGDCPIKSMQYKWDVPPYKRVNHSFKNHKVHKEEFISLYKMGYSYYSIAKKFGIEPAAVRYHLIKEGIYAK